MTAHRTASADEVTDLDDRVREVVRFAASICDATHPADVIETLFSAFLHELQTLREFSAGGNQAGLHVLREVVQLTTALRDTADAAAASELLKACHDALSMEKH
jgi:hypothetical protein